MGGARDVAIITSNRAEALARELADRVRAEREACGPFHPVTIVVPTATIRGFLEFELARRLGVCAHTRFLHWSSFVESLTGRDHGATPVDAVQAALIAALDDETLLLEDDLAPARRYVGAVADADAASVRRFQLAGRLARLFDEYAIHRPDLLAAWRADSAASVDSRVQSIERMQRALWRRVFASSDAAVRARVLDDRLEFDAGILPPVVHVFGFSYLGRAYHEVLIRLGALATVQVYALHPCVEFATDLASLEPPAGLAELPEPPGAESLFGGPDLAARGTIAPVGDWARAGRANLDLFLKRSAGAPVDLVPRYATPGDSARPTVLEALQGAILFRSAAAAPLEAPIPADSTVRVVACPDARREVEAVASDIWQRIGAARDAGSPLRFHEIGVVVNPARLDAVHAHVASVFSEAHDIPYSLLDVPAEHASRAIEGVRRLLELPLGAFTRRDVLEVLSHPAFDARHPGGDPDRWLRWCDTTGVLQGIDRDSLAGSYVERDLYTFDQGVRRVVLGSFLGDAPDGEPVFAYGGDVVRPEPVDDAEQASLFSLAVRSLLADAEYARGACMPLKAWAEFLGHYISGYLAAGDDEDEARAFDRARAAVSRLASIDLDGRDVDYRTASAFVLQSLSSLTASRGQPLADGVTVSSFQPMRAVPFRVLYVIGLDEGAFPAAEPRDPLDLRLAPRRAGDVRVSERDRFMFLEAVLSARDALVVSYVNRDPATQALRPPSSVVGELEWTLERSVVGAQIGELVVEHPLDRHSDAYLASRALALVTNGGDRERDARRLGESLTAHCDAHDVARPGLAVLPARLPDASRARVERALALEDVPPAARPERGDQPVRVEVSLSMLRKFLRNPLQGWAQAVLGLVAFDDDDPIGETDEAFAAGRLSRSVVLRDVLRASLRLDAPSLDVAYGQAIARYEASGDAPTALFQRIERESHVARLQGWRATLRDYGLDAPQHRHMFGRIDDRGDDVVRHDAIEVDATWDVDGTPKSHRVVVTGTSGAVVEGDIASVIPVVRERSNVADWLTGYLDHLALSAIERGRDDYRVLVMAGKGPQCIALDPRTPQEARAWFGAIAADLFGGPHEYRLSADAALSSIGGDLTLVDAVRRCDREATAYDPVRHVGAFDPPPENVAAAMVARRYGELLGRVAAS